MELPCWPCWQLIRCVSWSKQIKIGGSFNGDFIGLVLDKQLNRAGQGANAQYP